MFSSRHPSFSQSYIILASKVFTSSLSHHQWIFPVWADLLHEKIYFHFDNSYYIGILSQSAWQRSLTSCQCCLNHACPDDFFLRCFTGVSDEVKCFHCNGGLKGWEPKDAPWEEHAKWFPACPHVILMKGREFVKAVQEKTVSITVMLDLIFGVWGAWLCGS